MDTHTRTLVKSITWRLVALVTTVAAVWYYSHDWTLALTSGLVANVVKFVLYYIHERVWNKVKWGTFKKSTSTKSQAPNKF